MYIHTNDADIVRSENLKHRKQTKYVRILNDKHENTLKPIMNSNSNNCC